MSIELYDTTLRDGTQGEGISLSVDDKLKIAGLLDEFGVRYIEGGWPGSNPKDAAFFERARTLNLKHATIAAFGATCRVGSQPGNDPNLRAMLDSETATCTVVGKTWLLHVTEVIRCTPEENLRIIRESLAAALDQACFVVAAFPEQGLQGHDLGARPIHAEPAIQRVVHALQLSSHTFGKLR